MALLGTTTCDHSSVCTRGALGRKVEITKVLFSLLHLSPSADECRRHLSICWHGLLNWRNGKQKRKKEKKNTLKSTSHWTKVTLNEDDHMAATSVSFSFDLFSCVLCVLLRKNWKIFLHFFPHTVVFRSTFVFFDCCKFYIIIIPFTLTHTHTHRSNSKNETSPLLQRGKCGRLQFLLPGVSYLDD